VDYPILNVLWTPLLLVGVPLIYFLPTIIG
jgi:hypothetical protein